MAKDLLNLRFALSEQLLVILYVSPELEYSN